MPTRRDNKETQAEPRKRRRVKPSDKAKALEKSKAHKQALEQPQEAEAQPAPAAASDEAAIGDAVSPEPATPTASDDAAAPEGASADASTDASSGASETDDASHKDDGSAHADTASDGENAESDEPGASDDEDSPEEEGTLRGIASKVKAGARKLKPRRDPSRPRRWPLVLVLSILAFFAVCTVLFCWQKWWRFDDAADIQGEWKVEATGDTIVMDARQMKLTTSISYDYRLDTDAKTITYSFGKMEGGGHYYFDADRTTLVIVDGTDRLGVLAELGFLSDSAVAADSATDNITVLKKVSDNTDAEPSSTRDGTAMGGFSRGERDYVMNPEPVSSSSSNSNSSSRSSSSTRSSSSSDDEDEESSSSSSSRSSSSPSKSSSSDEEEEDSLENEEELEDQDDFEDVDPAESDVEDEYDTGDTSNDSANGENDGA